MRNDFLVGLAAIALVFVASVAMFQVLRALNLF
jgi:hypothetical protein